MILRHSKYLNTHTARDDTVKKHGWNCFWLEFLETKEATISHRNGLIQVPTTPHRDGPLRPELESRLPHGQMPELLGAYCQYILKKGLSISAAKARVNAVIWLHKVKGVRHECLKASMKAMWKKEVKYVNSQKQKGLQPYGDFFGLTDKQLSDLDNRAWHHKRKRAPLEAAFRVVYECIREAIFRPTSVTLKTLTDIDIGFRMEDVKFGHADDKVQCLDMTIREKIEGNSTARVRLKKWNTLRRRKYERGGLFNAMKIYLDLNPQNKTGPIAYPDGSPVTYRRFAARLRWWGLYAGIPSAVTPEVLRRSTIKNFAHRVPETQLRFLAHHLSEETAKKYYLHLTKEEVADIRASLAVQYTGGTLSKDSNLIDQPKMLALTLFPWTPSLRFVLIVLGLELRNHVAGVP